MEKKLRVIVACDDAAGIRLIKSIMSSGHTIVGVLAVPSSLSISSPYRFAINSGLQAWPADNAGRELFAALVCKEQADVILSMRFPFIFNKKVIEAPRIGAFNLHTGLLPQYAGANVSCWAIYNGEHQHGVTLHKMEAAIDTGPIVDQVRFDIEDSDTGLTLTRKSINFGVSMAGQFLKRVSRGEKLTLMPQNPELRKYYSKAIPQQGCINWKQKAQVIYNFIRACDFYPLSSPWGFPRASFRGEKLHICKSALTCSSSRKSPGSLRFTSNQDVEVATGDRWLRLEFIEHRGLFLHPGAILTDGARLEDGRLVS